MFSSCMLERSKKVFKTLKKYGYLSDKRYTKSEDITDLIYNRVFSFYENIKIGMTIDEVHALMDSYIDDEFPGVLELKSTVYNSEPYYYDVQYFSETPSEKKLQGDLSENYTTPLIGLNSEENMYSLITSSISVFYNKEKTVMGKSCYNLDNTKYNYCIDFIPLYNNGLLLDLSSKFYKSPDNILYNVCIDADIHRDVFRLDNTGYVERLENMSDEEYESYANELCESIGVDRLLTKKVLPSHSKIVSYSRCTKADLIEYNKLIDSVNSFVNKLDIKMSINDVLTLYKSEMESDSLFKNIVKSCKISDGLGEYESREIYNPNPEPKRIKKVWVSKEIGYEIRIELSPKIIYENGFFNPSIIITFKTDDKTKSSYCECISICGINSIPYYFDMSVKSSDVDIDSYMKEEKGIESVEIKKESFFGSLIKKIFK